MADRRAHRVPVITCLVAAGLCLVGCAGHRPAVRTDVQEALSAGLVVMFPGVINTRHHMEGMADLVRENHPGWEIDLRNWGPPLLSLDNLTAYKRNRETAGQRADEIVAYRRAHPHARITVLGYSGGGGMALFTVEALPPEVQIDRLVLIAPAISAEYPIRELVLPHVREFVVNYASAWDLQVGWGTHLAGTMDRVNAHSCGFNGFKLDDPRVIDVFWSPEMIEVGHLGNHLGYTSRPWQREFLAPALEPTSTPTQIRELNVESNDPDK